MSPQNTLKKCSFCLSSPWLLSLLPCAVHLAILQGESSGQVHFFEPLDDMTFSPKLHFCHCSPRRMSKVLQASLPLSSCPLPGCSTSCPMPGTGKYPTEKNGFSESWAYLSESHVSPGSGSSNLDWSVALLLLQTGVFGFYLAFWLPAVELLVCYIPLCYSWKLKQTMFVLFHFKMGSVKKTRTTEQKNPARYQWHYKHLT